MTKIYLVLGVLFTIFGLLVSAEVIDGEEFPLLYGALPLGAVFLGLFGIGAIFGKESARYDEEHMNRH